MLTDTLSSVTATLIQFNILHKMCMGLYLFCNNKMFFFLALLYHKRLPLNAAVSKFKYIQLAHRAQYSCTFSIIADTWEDWLMGRSSPDGQPRQTLI